MDPHLVLFALDDTLVDRRAMVARWAGQVVADLGVDHPQLVAWLVDALGDRRSAFPAETFELAVMRWGVELTVPDLVARYEHEAPVHARLEREVATTLDVVRGDGWRVGVVGSGSPSPARVLRSCGLDRLVDGWALGGGDDPASVQERLTTAAARCGASLEGAWIVGADPVVDIGGGHDAGCSTVWLHHDRTWELSAYRPDAIVSAVADVAALLLEPDVYLPGTVFGL